MAALSASGCAKNVADCANVAAINSAGTPWFTTEKKPVSRAATPMSCASARNPAGLPDSSAPMSMIGTAGVTLQCDAMPSTNTGLRANEETVLALALREAVTNIVRHARATTCTLRFFMAEGQHRLSVEDNGIPATNLREGNGLRGMRERVESLGGTLRIESASGTKLVIEIPLQKPVTDAVVSA